MEEIVTIDNKQYKLSYDQILTMEQRSQVIADIRAKIGCGCKSSYSNSNMYQLQGSPCATANLLPPDVTVTGIAIGDIDCPSGACPDITCTSVGCTTETRNIVATYSSSSDATIIPFLTVSKFNINVNDAVRNGAYRLLTTQNIDGTWEWQNPDTNPTTTNYPAENNTLGVTARGLVSAYSITGNTVYLDAAKKTADLLKGKTPDGFGPDDIGTTGKHKVYGQDITFLVEFADAWTGAGNDGADYYAQANNYMNHMLNNPNRFCPGGCPGEEALALAIVQERYANRTPNLYGWDIKGWVEASVKINNMTLATALVSNMITYANSLSSTASGGYPTGSSYVLGVAGYLQSYILTGMDYSSISDMYNKLMAEILPDGSFKIYDPTFDGIDQTAAYALMALNLTNTDITNTVNYLVSVQSPGGQWIESDSNEYSEVDSEVIVALASSVKAYHTGIATSVTGGTPLPMTFDNVSLSRGINHICADWT